MSKSANLSLLALDVQKQYLEAAPRMGRRPGAVLYNLFAEVRQAALVRRSCRLEEYPQPLALAVGILILANVVTTDREEVISLTSRLVHHTAPYQGRGKSSVVIGS